MLYIYIIYAGYSNGELVYKDIFSNVLQYIVLIENDCTIIRYHYAFYTLAESIKDSILINKVSILFTMIYIALIQAV